MTFMHNPVLSKKIITYILQKFDQKTCFVKKRLHLLLPRPAYCSGGLPLIQVSFTKSNPSGF